MVCMVLLFCGAAIWLAVWLVRRKGRKLLLPLACLAVLAGICVLAYHPRLDCPAEFALDAEQRQAVLSVSQGFRYPYLPLFPLRVEVTDYRDETVMFVIHYNVGHEDVMTYGPDGYDLLTRLH